MSSTMVDVRSAVSAARDYLQQLTDLLLDSDKTIKGLRLEETELSENKQYWLITLGFDLPVDAHRDPLQSIGMNKKYGREYRIFKIDAQTGEVQSMKIREL
jgi:hypothetical protein